jgi:hypothetical protein
MLEERLDEVWFHAFLEQLPPQQRDVAPRGSACVATLAHLLLCFGQSTA